MCFTTAGLNNTTQITKLKLTQHFLYPDKGELDADSWSLHSPTLSLDPLETKSTLMTQISLGSTHASHLVALTYRREQDKEWVGQGFFRGSLPVTVFWHDCILEPCWEELDFLASFCGWEGLFGFCFKKKTLNKLRASRYVLSQGKLTTWCLPEKTLYWNHPLWLAGESRLLNSSLGRRFRNKMCSFHSYFSTIYRSTTHIAEY